VISSLILQMLGEGFKGDCLTLAGISEIFTELCKNEVCFEVFSS
jgi:hypothetical protein